MEAFLRTVQLRWSDLDPNFHLRHSIYYDWAAMCRLDFLKERGLISDMMQKHHFGPVVSGKKLCSVKK